MKDRQFTQMALPLIMAAPQPGLALVSSGGMGTHGEYHHDNKTTVLHLFVKLAKLKF